MLEQSVAKLLQIEQQVRCCETATDLGFVMVNMTRDLVAYQQAAFLVGSELEQLKLSAVSDISLIDRTTPFSAWLEKLAVVVDDLEQSSGIYSIETKRIPATLLNDLNDFSSPYMLWLPLLIPAKPNQRVGVLWLAKSQPWTDKEKGLLQHLASSYAHAMQVFVKDSGWRVWRKRLLAKKVPTIALVTAVLLGFIPVRQSALAPAEIIAKDSLLVTAAIAGAVSEVLVKPGDTVVVGQPIVLLDKTEYQGRYDVAQRELERALSELRTTEQAGYVDRRRNAELSELEAQVQLKTIERDYLKTKLDQTQILANKSGVTVLDDPEKWRGRPVVVGERILSIADPAKVQLEIMLPVSDAISLERGDEVTFFLDIDPLNPIHFLVDYSSFEPNLTPSQVIAYRIVADMQGDDAPPRIGLRGTAKLYGESVSLAYYLFRRPITFVRQYLGW